MNIPVLTLSSTVRHFGTGLKVPGSISGSAMGVFAKGMLINYMNSKLWKFTRFSIFVKRGLLQ